MPVLPQLLALDLAERSQDDGVLLVERLRVEGPDLRCELGGLRYRLEPGATAQGVVDVVRSLGVVVRDVPPAGPLDVGADGWSPSLGWAWLHYDFGAYEYFLRTPELSGTDDLHLLAIERRGDEAQIFVTDGRVTGVWTHPLTGEPDLGLPEVVGSAFTTRDPRMRYIPA